MTDFHCMGHVQSPSPIIGDYGKFIPIKFVEQRYDTFRNLHKNSV